MIAMILLLVVSVISLAGIAAAVAAEFPASEALRRLANLHAEQARVAQDGRERAGMTLRAGGDSLVDDETQLLPHEKGEKE